MPQTKKTLIGLANLKHRRAAASAQRISTGQIASTSAVILHNGQHEKRRSYKALSISFITLSLLMGCGDNEPSNSDIKKQLSHQISPCPELSITDFQKINGYPQNDGSYIEQVQYVVTFTPSDAMLSLVSDYDKTQQALARNEAAVTARRQKLEDQVVSIVGTCRAAYKSTVDGYNSTLKDFGFSLDDVDNAFQDESMEGLDNLISQQTNILLSAQKALAYDNSDQWQPPSNANVSDDFNPYQPPPPPPSAQQIEANKQLQEKAIDADKKNIDNATNAINNLKQIEAQYANAGKDFQTCFSAAQQTDQEAQTPLGQTSNLEATLHTQSDQDQNALYSDLNQDCPINIPGGVLGMFNASPADPDAYKKTLRAQMSGNVHLVKSDNGWVIQN